MVDVVSAQKRSEMMSNIKNKHTHPEIIVRKYLQSIGYRYRLGKKIFGFKPDIVLSKYKVAVFVHGCFWHRHIGCKLATTPKSNQEFWQKKFEKNLQRDKNNTRCLAQQGWSQIVIWECCVREGSFINFDFQSAVKIGGFYELSSPLVIETDRRSKRKY